MSNRIYGAAIIQFSKGTTETNPHKAIQDMIDKISDEIGIDKIELKLSCTNGEVIELVVDSWRVNELEYFDENGMQE